MLFKFLYNLLWMERLILKFYKEMCKDKLKYFQSRELRIILRRRINQFSGSVKWFTRVPDLLI